MRILAALPILCLALPLPVAAQVLSPGPLSRDHAHLEGLTNCTRCHGGGERVSAGKCLACHEALGARVDAGRGFHGRLPPDRRACESCHPEHRGRDAALVRWPEGRARFDHRQAGWPLTGAHARVKCEACHDPRLVTDPGVRRERARSGDPATFLGLPTACAACHFDAHRGQLEGACDRCHDTRAFAPAPGFDHARTGYPLEGRHRQVACAKCHPADVDEETPADAFPRPASRSYARYADVAHAACADCHADPHQGRFGPSCERCHDVSGWRTLKQAARDAAFHDRTRYPLRGAHRTVACEACHGRPPTYRGLAFGACTDCHADAHHGQLEPPACERCHDVEGFVPPAFRLEDHQRTAYPLEGAHAAVACSLCHPQDGELATRPPPQRRRANAVSAARFDVPHARCADCHRDPHAGQLDARLAEDGCEGCHVVVAFDRLVFDHDTDSRFPLEGAHAEVRCAQCHFRAREAAGRPVTVYRPLDTACVACHADPHLGQFAGRFPGCRSCHTQEAFKPARFDHADPRYTDFRLEGRHAAVPCAGCHPVTELDGRTVQRFSAVPTRCEGCHRDPHEGAFAELARLPEPIEGCADCHTVEGFADARFDHGWTGFPLVGRHRRVRCEACHPSGFVQALPTTCAGCHRDPHGGQLGLSCDRCHDPEDAWHTEMDVAMHARTDFPLTGRHALVSCLECHPEARERTFSRVSPECVTCHLEDYERTTLGSIDHVAAGFPTRCQNCHQTWRFAPARWFEHDRCFPITRGDHAGIRCLDCHTRLDGVSTGGACATFTAACTGCHEHNRAEADDEHGDVPGYEYADRRCYECHRFGEAD